MSSLLFSREMKPVYRRAVTFIAVQFPIVKKWTPSRCLSAEEWIKKMWFICVYTVKYYSSIKNEILSFVTTWMDLRDVRLNEINWAQNDKFHMTSLICESRKVDLTEAESRRVVTRGWREWRRGKDGETLVNRENATVR